MTLVYQTSNIKVDERTVTESQIHITQMVSYTGNFMRQWVFKNDTVHTKKPRYK